MRDAVHEDTKTEDVPEDFSKDYAGIVRSCFLNIVKPEMLDRFHAECSEYFVMDQSVQSMRKPGN